MALLATLVLAGCGDHREGPKAVLVAQAAATDGGGAAAAVAYDAVDLELRVDVDAPRPGNGQLNRTEVHVKSAKSSGSSSSHITWVADKPFTLYFLSAICGSGAGTTIPGVYTYATSQAAAPYSFTCTVQQGSSPAPHLYDISGITSLTPNAAAPQTRRRGPPVHIFGPGSGDHCEGCLLDY